MGKEGTRNSLPTRDIPPPKFKLEGDLFYNSVTYTCRTIIKAQITTWKVSWLERINKVNKYYNYLN